MWLHEKHARENFAVTANFFFLCMWSEASLASNWKVTMLCKKNEIKVLLMETGRQKKTLRGYKIKQGSHFVSLDDWGQQTAKTWACKLAGQNYAALKAKMEQGEAGPRHLCKVGWFCTTILWGTGFWKNITCCERCRWGCCQGTMWQAGTNQSDSSLCICSGGWVITIHHQHGWCVHSGDSCFRERRQLLMPFNSRK